MKETNRQVLFDYQIALEAYASARKYDYLVNLQVHSQEEWLPETMRQENEEGVAILGMLLWKI